MKKIVFLLLILYGCGGTLFVTTKDLNILHSAFGTKKGKEFDNEEKKAVCLRNCDERYNKDFCNKTDWLMKLLVCREKFRPKSTCLKECYTPYCTCNEKPQDWNYGMCKHYCYKDGEKSNEKYDANIKK